MKDSKIQWCDHTFNPWIGCSKVSNGCKFCYAESLMDKRWGKVKWGPDGTRVRTSDANWRQPLTWNRAAKKAGTIARVFCASLADVGEDRPELLPHRGDLCGLIDQCDSLRFLLLSKRPENMPRLFPKEILEKCWVGTSVENQDATDERIPHLLKCPAKIRFLSVEPLLSNVDLPHSLIGHWTNPDGSGSWFSPVPGKVYSPLIGWCIVGGESGPGARPCDLAWINSIREQCDSAGVACFIKQLGAKPESTDPALHCGGITDPKGGDISEFPEILRIRQFPLGGV